MRLTIHFQKVDNMFFGYFIWWFNICMKNMNQFYAIIYFRKYLTFTWLAMQVYSLFSYSLEIASLFMPISLGSLQTFGYLNAYSNSFFISRILLNWCLNHCCNSGRYPQKLSLSLMSKFYICWYVLCNHDANMKLWRKGLDYHTPKFFGHIFHLLLPSD